MMVASTPPDTSCRFADQAEALEVPCISNDCPVAAVLLRTRRGRPTRRSSGHTTSSGALEDVTANFIAMWDALDTNKKVGEMWATDADGIAWSDPKTGQPTDAKARRLHLVHRHGPHPVRGTDDFTPQISRVQGGRRRHQ